MADVFARAFQHSLHASGDCDVVVLDENGVVETEAMVEAAAATHRVFFQRAQTRRGLAGVADAQFGACGVAHVVPRSG